MMRMGVELCDGVTEERKCTACMLQHRGMPSAAARVIAGTPAPLAEMMRRLPGRAGAVFALPSFIRDQKTRQQRLLDFKAAHAASVSERSKRQIGRLFRPRRGSEIPI